MTGTMYYPFSPFPTKVNERRKSEPRVCVQSRVSVCVFAIIVCHNQELLTASPAPVSGYGVTTPVSGAPGIIFGGIENIFFFTTLSILSLICRTRI